MRFEKDMILLLDKELLTKLKHCVKKANPYEACGLLFGNVVQLKNFKTENDFCYHYKAKEFECIESDRKSMVAFLIENIERLHEIILNKLEKTGNQNKLRLISIFHSHPGGAYPSSVDINNMQYLDYFSGIKNDYVSKAFKNQIWSIMDARNYELNGFIYLNDEITQIDVEFNGT